MRELKSLTCHWSSLCCSSSTWCPSTSNASAAVSAGTAPTADCRSKRDERKVFTPCFVHDRATAAAAATAAATGTAAIAL